MTKLTKAEKAERKYIKQQNAEFRKLQRQIVKKLKKAVMTKAIRFELLRDLDNCNNLELVHYLATQAQFTSDHEFVEAVNKFLELETIEGEFWQKVRIQDQQGRFHVMAYRMVSLDGKWLINGVQLLPSEEIGV